MNSTGIHRAVTLEQWSGRAWTDGLQVESLSPMETVLVRTRNSSYELTILSPATGEALVRGGRFFPEFTRTTLAGSSLRGACLKVRGVYVGFFLELLHEGRTVRTTRIQTVTRPPRPVPH